MRKSKADFGALTAALNAETADLHQAAPALYV